MWKARAALGSYPTPAVWQAGGSLAAFGTKYQPARLLVAQKLLRCRFLSLHGCRLHGDLIDEERVDVILVDQSLGAGTVDRHARLRPAEANRLAIHAKLPRHERAGGRVEHDCARRRALQQLTFLERIPHRRK